MRIARLVYRPSIIASLAAAIMMIVFLGMGIWQLQRAEEKQQILSDYEARNAQMPVKLELPFSNTEDWRYRKVSISGTFNNRRQLLLDNQVSQGQVGYAVITPLKIDYQDAVILVDRGWLPLGQSRERLPNVEVTTEKVELTGSVYVPFGEPYALGEMDSADDVWPRVIQFLDFEQIGERLGVTLPELTLRLDGTSDHAYRQDWKIIAFTPQRHLAYAFQWFAMAAALLVIYVLMSVKTKEIYRSDENK